MALSDFATAALDRDGNPTNGVLVTPSGVTCRIYKNWLYIEDPLAWRPNGGYVEPIVMEIRSGYLTYQDLHVYAERGPQGGIYVLAFSSDGKECMVGVGCKAHLCLADSYLSSKGLDSLLDAPLDWCYILSSDEEGCVLEGSHKEDRDVSVTFHLDEEEYDEHTKWVGVNDAVVQHLARFIHNLKLDHYVHDYVPESLDKLLDAEYNQGDAFFVGSENAQEKCKTDKEPMLMRALPVAKDAIRKVSPGPDATLNSEE